jgi:RNA polymerase sigma factor (sigma-70 family)
LRTVTAFPAWTFSIVRRKCHPLWRLMRGEVEPPAADHPIFAYAEHPELRLNLAAAIQWLPEKYREAIILRDFEEFSITEITEQLSLTRDAVRSRIQRGRPWVQEYLKD